MTNKEFDQRMAKLAARHEALNQAIELRDKVLEAIGAQLASVKRQLKVVVDKQR